jgi:exopolysaccharide biosynthesis protein
MGEILMKKNSKKTKILLVVFIVIVIAVVITLKIVMSNNNNENESESVAKVDEPEEETVVEDEGEYYDESIVYENEYEEAVLKRTNKNNDYKIIEINGDKFHGYLTAIYDPSRIRVATTSKVGTAGEYLTEISKANNALVAINGGGFADANFNGDGSTPLGVTIANGQTITKNTYGGSYGIIGFNAENKLILGKYTEEKAKEMGIRDAVTFGPFLIVNGSKVSDLGSSALGRAPRTAIAQREDGIVLFLVLDGSRTKNEGAVYSEEIEILLKYGAVTAANLDGGTSTCMTVNGTLVNDPTSMNGEHRTREIATAFMLIADDSDNSDHSIVADKLQ